MIIELSGIPGAGKSTVIKSLIDSMDNTKYIFDVRKYILNQYKIHLDKTYLYDFILLLNILKLKKEDLRIIRDSAKIVLNGNNKLFHKINILRNIMKKFIIYRYIQNKEEVFFIDEGITHIAFNIFVDINKKIDDEEIKRFLKTLPKVDKLLIIDAEDSDLLDRVIKRGKEGHRRINFDSDEDVELFMKQSRIVLNVIKKELKGYIYMNVGREIKTKEIIQNIGLENV